MSYQPDRQRLPRVVGSCFLIGLGFAGIVTASRGRNVSASPALTIFAAFLIVSSLLITTVVYRLYLQHKVRRLNFDLANLMLLTVLIALPFAVSNALWGHFKLNEVAKIQENRTTLLLGLSCATAFLLLPVFFVTEALLSWYSLIFRAGDR